METGLNPEIISQNFHPLSKNLIQYSWNPITLRSSRSIEMTNRELSNPLWFKVQAVWILKPLTEYNIFLSTDYPSQFLSCNSIFSKIIKTISTKRINLFRWDRFCRIVHVRGRRVIENVNGRRINDPNCRYPRRAVDWSRTCAAFDDNPRIPMMPGGTGSARINDCQLWRW